jgi:hypothetical protein
MRRRARERERKLKLISNFYLEKLQRKINKKGHKNLILGNILLHNKQKQTTKQTRR